MNWTMTVRKTVTAEVVIEAPNDLIAGDLVIALAEAGKVTWDEETTEYEVIDGDAS